MANIGTPSTPTVRDAPSLLIVRIRSGRVIQWGPSSCWNCETLRNDDARVEEGASWRMLADVSRNGMFANVVV